MASILTGFLGVFFTMIGTVKCFQSIPEVYAMQMGAIGTRYQPAMVSLAPRFIGSRIEAMPTEDLIFWIGLPELLFGILLLLSLLRLVPRNVDQSANRFMALFMLGPLAVHYLGDGWTLSKDSNVGPTGIVPAVVIFTLLLLRLIISGSTEKSKKE